MKAKRNYKDSLFRSILNNKENLLSLYNALEGTDFKNPEEVRITTLKGTFYNGLKNDISFELGGQFVVLLEHQSTVSGNMPLRCLLYLAKLYQEYVDARLLYRENTVKIPAPRFYVFYNGLQEEAEQKTLHLSEAFRGAGMMELSVKAYNINLGHNAKLMEGCQALHEYSIFVDLVRQYVRGGMSVHEAIESAIDYCLKHDILKEFLDARSREVRDMFNMEFDLETAKSVWKEEAMENGYAIGMEKGMAEGMEKGMAQGMEKGMAQGMEKGMAQGMEKGMAQGRTEGRAEGAEANRLSTAIDMLKENLDRALIARITKLSPEKINELALTHLPA